MKSTCLIGLGYIGLPTAGILASRGVKVHGVDINLEILDRIHQGKIHISEDGLNELIQSAIADKMLSVSSEPIPADVFIIAVPTPLNLDKTPDLSCVEAAVKSCAHCLRPNNLIILESTCPVGTTETVRDWLIEVEPQIQDMSLHIAYCPERVLPGNIIHELVNNSRIIGGLDNVSAEKAKQFYQQFIDGDILITDARTAEIVKLSENTFRDVNIAFANELSMICDRLNINVQEVIQLANHHPRVNILQPGPGVGGHCIAVDPWFIVSSQPDLAQLIKTSRQVNTHKTKYVANQIKQQLLRSSGCTVAFLGLTYKANVNDLRESPSVEIIKDLAEENIGLFLVVDPYVETLPPSLSGYSSIQKVELQTALDKSDIVILLVNHKEFSDINFHDLRGRVIMNYQGSLEILSL